MMLTVSDIENKTFTVVRLREGYSQKEVDEFLDSTAVTLRALEAELDGYRRVDTTVIPIIPSEIKEASTLLEIAKQEAERIKDAAREAGRSITAEAAKKGEEIVAEATREKHAELGRLEDQRQALQARVHELENHKARVTERLAAALKEVEQV